LPLKKIELTTEARRTQRKKGFERPALTGLNSIPGEGRCRKIDSLFVDILSVFSVPLW